MDAKYHLRKLLKYMPDLSSNIHYSHSSTHIILQLWKWIPMRYLPLISYLFNCHIQLWGTKKIKPCLLCGAHVTAPYLYSCLPINRILISWLKISCVCSVSPVISRCIILIGAIHFTCFSQLLLLRTEFYTKWSFNTHNLFLHI